MLATRIEQLREALQINGSYEKWTRENLTLWRVSDDDQVETWYSPSGNEFFSVDEVVKYVESLPEGGSSAKLLLSAPKVWDGAILELEDTEDPLNWVRSRVVERLSEWECLVQLPDDTLKKVDLSGTRCRWDPPESPPAGEQQHNIATCSKGDNVAKVKSIPPKGIPRSKSARFSNKLPWDSEIKWIFKSKMKVVEESNFMKEELVKLCTLANVALPNASSRTALAIASLLEIAESKLVNLSHDCNPVEVLSSREAVTSKIIASLVMKNARNNKGWLAYVQCNFDQSSSSIGYMRVRFKSYEGDFEGVVNLARFLESERLALDASIVDKSWEFYQILDIIQQCEVIMRKLMDLKAT